MRYPPYEPRVEPVSLPMTCDMLGCPSSETLYHLTHNPSLLQPWPRACLPTSNNHVDNYAWIQKLCTREADTVEQTTLMTKPAMGTMILRRRGSVNPNSDERHSLTIPTKDSDPEGHRNVATPRRRVTAKSAVMPPATGEVVAILHKCSPGCRPQQSPRRRDSTVHSDRQNSAHQ